MALVSEEIHCAGVELSKGVDNLKLLVPVDKELSGFLTSLKCSIEYITSMVPFAYQLESVSQQTVFVNSPNDL